MDWQPHECAGLFPYGRPRMQELEELQKEMQHVSLEKCSVWDDLSFPEKRKAVEARVRSTCKTILERHRDENILLVGHGLSIHFVVSSMKQCSPCLRLRQDHAYRCYCMSSNVLPNLGKMQFLRVEAICTVLMKIFQPTMAIDMATGVPVMSTSSTLAVHPVQQRW